MKNCPNCGNQMEFRLGVYDCSCGHVEEKALPDEVQQAEYKPSGPGFKQSWGGDQGGGTQPPPPGTLHTPGAAPPPGLESRMAALGQEAGSGGGGRGIVGLDGEKKTYMIIKFVLYSLAILGGLAGCALGVPSGARDGAGIILGCAVDGLLTWYVLTSAPSCLKWGCIVLVGFQVLSSLIGVFTIPSAVMQGGVSGGVWVVTIIIWLLALAFNAWFVMILYRDVQGYEY